jgi:hypothetical protein
MYQETEKVQTKEQVGVIQENVEINQVDDSSQEEEEVDSIQKELEVSMGNVSGRLREQPSKIKQDDVVDKIELQGDNNQMKQEVKDEETMQIERVETETSGLSGRLWENKSQSETGNSSLQQNNDVMLLYQGQMIKESYESKVYPERKAHKSREIKFKQRKQKWLKVYRKLKERVERTINKNRKTKVRRQLQAWLRVNCRSDVRTKVNQ